MNATPQACFTFVGFTLFISPPVSDAQWIQTSGPISLNPVALLSVAVTGDTIFTGAYQGGGIYRSFDGGVNWTEVAAGDAYSHMNALLMSDKIVYAGNYSGVYHSTDYGDHWIKNDTTLPERAEINSLTILNEYLFAASDYGVFRSSDGGNRWISVNSGLPEGLCSTIFSITALNTTMIIGTSGGIYRSTNYGTNWVQSNSGLPIGFYGCPARVNTLLVDGNNIFAGTDGYGIYRSINHGLSWDSVNTGLPPGYNPGFYMSVRSLGLYQNTVMAGLDGGSIYISTDSGTNWDRLIDRLSAYAYIFDFAVSENKIFAATLDGLFQSNGIDTHWNPLLTRYPRYFIAYKMAIGNQNLIASGWSNYWNGSIENVFYSPDGGDTWHEIDSLSPVRWFNCFAFGDSMLLAGTDQIYRSADDGIHWTEADSSPAISPVNSIVIREDNILAGTGGDWWQFGEWGGVFKSTDGARSWTLIGLKDTMITSLATMQDTIFAGGQRSIYRSDDDGTSWTRCDSGVPEDVFTRSLLTVGDTLIAGTDLGIYLSTDMGSSWSARNNGLPFDSTHTTNIYSMISYLDHLFMGTNRGVYHSSDMGMNWESISDDLGGSTLPVYSLSVQDDYIFAGTRGGVWRRAISGVVSVEDPGDDPAPQSYTLYQNNPNPFNPSTSITYSLSMAGLVSVRIFDILGREVATLIHERKEVGKHTVEWNARSIPSGIYLYRITTERFSDTKKMVLVK